MKNSPVRYAAFSEKGKLLAVYDTKVQAQHFLNYNDIKGQVRPIVLKQP